MAILTSRSQASGVTLDDLIHIVITSDQSQNPAGSSYKATIGQVFDSLSSYTFTNLSVNGNLNVSGNTILNNVITNTLSATTYLGLPGDIFITGGTFDKNTETLTLERSSGSSITITGFTDTYITGFTYDDANTITLSLNNGQSSGITLNTFTGLTSNTISATTYYNLPPFTGTNFISVTYDELYTKVTTDLLEPNRWYRLTDYKSVNFLNGWEIANNNPTPYVTGFTPQEIYTGETEVLLLQAITTNSISPIGYSENYPQDIVDYWPYTNKIGVLHTFNNGGFLPNGNPISGFNLQWDSINNEVYFNMPTGYPALFGHPFQLRYRLNSPSRTFYGTYFPLKPGLVESNFVIINSPLPKIRVENGGQKIVLVGLTYSDFLTYFNNSLRVGTIYEIGDSYGLIVRRNDTEINIDVPFDFRGRKYRRFNIELFGDITKITYSNTGTTASAGGDDRYIGVYGALAPTGVTNASFDITVVSGSVTSVTIVDPGGFFKINDTITILGSQISGVDGVDDVIITVDDIYSEIGYFGIGDEFNGQISNGDYVDFKTFNNLSRTFSYNIIWKDVGGIYRPVTNIAAGCDNVVFLGETYNNKIYSYFNNNTLTDFTYNEINSIFYSNINTETFTQNNFNYFSSSNIFGKNFRNNKISSNFTNNKIKESFSSNDIKEDFSNNKIGFNFQRNEISNTFNNNIILNNFNYNKITGSFYNNFISNSLFANTFGDNTNSNNIGTNFANNLIGNEFTDNLIGDYFISNIIGSLFFNNTIGDNFKYNTVKNNSVLNTDFSTATHVYGDYDCTIFRNFTGGTRLSYYDSSDILTITGITS